MPRNVNDVIKKLSMSRRKQVEARAAVLIAEEMTLQELRKARKMTQTRLAKDLGIAQKQISEIEKRTDMHISTLRRAVEALGGSLTLVAQFPDRGPVAVSGIATLGTDPLERPANRRIE
jgi:transcriptional regulator with XRE-family HTH domain